MFGLAVMTRENETDERGSVCIRDAVARSLAVGGTVQELSSPTPVTGATHVYRSSHGFRTTPLGVHGASAREWREREKFFAFSGWSHAAEIFDSGHQPSVVDHVHDAGRSNIDMLPENPALVHHAGRVFQLRHGSEENEIPQFFATSTYSGVSDGGSVMLEMALAAVFVTVAVLAIGGKGLNPADFGLRTQVALVEESWDLPCPWCQAQTREVDKHCPTCGQRFG